jgi:hypothetical protein
MVYRFCGILGILGFKPDSMESLESLLESFGILVGILRIFGVRPDSANPWNPRNQTRFYGILLRFEEVLGLTSIS